MPALIKDLDVRECQGLQPAVVIYDVDVESVVDGVEREAELGPLQGIFDSQQVPWSGSGFTQPESADEGELFRKVARKHVSGRFSEINILDEAVSDLHAVGAPDLSHAGHCEIHGVQFEIADEVEPWEIVFSWLDFGADGANVLDLILGSQRDTTLQEETEQEKKTVAQRRTSATS